MASKNYSQFGYLVSFIPSLLVMYGNLTGGWIAGINAFFTLVILAILDWLMPEDTSHPEEVSNLFANSILVAHVIIQLIAILTLFFGISQGILFGPYILLAIISTGINSGQSGIIVAHELIHRKSTLLRTLGNWNLLLVLYTHWSIEHRYGHHKWVGTYKDPATARFGESVYHFVVRTIPQQFISAFKIEWNRRKGKNTIPWGPKNFVIKGYTLQILLLVAIFQFLGMIYVLAFIGQAIIAIILLEMVNYIEHYGLLREETEPFVVELAWNTDVIPSRYFLIELVRHSDHHLKSYKPFQSLISYNEEQPCTVPTLPSGYWGVFYLIFIPWIWRKIIHPRIPKRMIELHHNLTDQNHPSQIIPAG